MLIELNFFPNEREQMICSLVFATSSSSMQDSPFSSLTVRSTTTPNVLRIMVVSALAKSSAVTIPIAFSRLLIFLPTPHTSLTGTRDMSRFWREVALKSTTPPVLVHVLAAWFASLASVLV